MKEVINSITLEKFAFPVLGVYELATESGKVRIEVLSKTSHHMPGDCTVYTVKVDGNVYTDKVIGFYKKMFGAVVNHRDGSAISSVKVLSDTEISEKVASLSATITNLVERLNKVCTVANPDFAAISVNVDELTTSYRSVLLSNNDKAKAEREMQEKAKAEREKKAERKELAKSVAELDDMQAELYKAIIAKDFAKVAELSAKIATA
jgi:hypothetical protein